MNNTPKCPECHRTVKLATENQAYPFCSGRCQRIDLSRWLGGEYVVSTDLSAFGNDRETLEAAVRILNGEE